jgi:hypothetical protein
VSVYAQKHIMNLSLAELRELEEKLATSVAQPLLLWIMP